MKAGSIVGLLLAAFATAAAAPAPDDQAGAAASALTASINDKTHELTETMFDPAVQVEGDLAHVWTPCSFDTDGKRSHRGFDSIALAKADGTWRIASLTRTVEPAGCAKWKK